MMQISSLSPIASQPAAPKQDASLEKAAQQFEAIFLRQMIGAMRSASLADGITDSSATAQFRDMADARTADALANRNSMGIAQLLIRQLGDKTPAAPSLSQISGSADGK